MSAQKQTRNRKTRKPHSDFRRLSAHFMSSLLRSLFLMNKPVRNGQAGFVLPTTVLLLLMVTLTAGALSFRSFSRTQAVIAQREQEVIVGAASPAVDRAKAKIEYLFSQDIRFPGGLPTSNKLQAMMKNVANAEAAGSSNTPLPGTPTGTDPQGIPPYTLPDETRLDLNGDGNLDNAWVFTTDIDGDGTASDTERVVYSVIMDDAQQIDPTDSSSPVKDIDDAVNSSKARSLVSRNASIDTATQGNSCPTFGATDVSTDTRDINSPGWEQLDNVTLLKNFQIDAFVVNDNPTNRTVSTLEFQQVRQAIRGNKWGAWFKNDIELFPGAGFIWNGAMHTEGSVFLGNAPSLYMISSHNSCLYPDPTASEITLAVNSNPDVFQGQFIAGRIGDGSFTDSGNGSPIVDWFASYNTHGRTTLSSNGNNDSVVPTGGNPDISHVAIDPVQMFTADLPRHRNSTTWERDANWVNSDITDNNRVLNQNENTPFLDDLYRADNRYGPKAAYTSNFALSDVDGGNGVSIGTDMGSTPPPELADPVNGLDGYWERQAIREGLRIIGGQRLELGNNTGWRGSMDTTAPSAPNAGLGLDPLYNEALSFNGTLSGTADKSMRLHRLSLRDNLAAVQSMAVYHAYGAGNGTFPMMCMSMTSHPGTPKTVTRSTSFNNISSSTTTLDIDFFNGYGTNGWEYAPPMGGESSFATAYNDNTSGLKKALRNLAYFAGDPLGGAPSFTPVQDEHIHPYPTFSMWGDFSHLRRLVDAGAPDSLESIAYADLSPADQSYLHTAACTLGMLADNIKTVQDFTLTTTSGGDLDRIAGAVGSIIMTDVGNPSDSSSIGKAFVLPTSPHAYLSLLETQAVTTAQKDVARLAKIFHLKEQIKRDRLYGFSQTPTSNPDYEYQLQFDQTLTFAGSTTRQTIPANTIVRLGVDKIANNYFGYGPPTTGLALARRLAERKFLQLAAIAGGIDVPSDAARTPYSNAGQPKYPSLFYLFPQSSHDHLGSGSTIQPVAEPYIDDGIDSSDSGNAPDQYVLNQDRTPPSPSSMTYAYQSLDDAQLTSIVLTRKAPGASNWTSPYVTPSTTAPNVSPNVISVRGANRAILLLDKGFMDGREMLSSRSIDLDIFLATSLSEIVATDTTISPSIPVPWIVPNTPSALGGIVYAFREDAKREDSIVRPIRTALGTAQDAWTACSANIILADCLMKLDFNSSFDPPLRRELGSQDNYISPKPVDYFADPLRRPYGFRLSNGSSLNRPATVFAGLSFISDNTIYIKGDFNLHKDSAGTTQEEFTTLLTANYSNFYTRSGADPDFANPAVDLWRPVEIVGDAVGILSDRWRDGAMSDTFTLPRPAFSVGGSSSYQNHLRPEGDSSGTFAGMTAANISNLSWFRENPYDGLNGVDSPVRVYRDGEFFGGQIDSEPITSNLMRLTTGNLNDRRKRDRIRAQQTTVNALLITGVVPSRRNQSNGGLHNFPRLLEHWRIGDSTLIDLNISGGFFQLNFSTSATGPWDQRADYWEPSSATSSSSPFSITFYGAPGRNWGYDVGLQFAPAGPVSTRFVTIGSPRSEYYQEVAADDPYMQNLQCAMGDLDGDGDNERVIANPTVTCPS